MPSDARGRPAPPQHGVGARESGGEAGRKGETVAGEQRALCVCVCVFRPHRRRKCASSDKRLPRASNVVQGISKPPKCCRGLPKAPKVFQGLQRLPGVMRSKVIQGRPMSCKGCQGLPRSSKGCQGLPKASKVFQGF